MLKETIKYTDHNGFDREEDFYFNISKSEVVKMELYESKTGGLQAKLEGIVASGDPRMIIDTFEELVSTAYGEKSEDGRAFIKNKEITERFKSSAAYDEFFLKLVTDADTAARFVRGVLPKEAQDRLEAKDANKQ